MNILVNMGHESVGLIVKLNAVNITNIVFSLMANRLFDQTDLYKSRYFIKLEQIILSELKLTQKTNKCFL